MVAEPAVHLDDVRDDELLDSDTSAAILRWMETAALPHEIDAHEWEGWIDAGCRGVLRARGVPVTPAMLGHWARFGTLG